MKWQSVHLSVPSINSSSGMGGFSAERVGNIDQQHTTALSSKCRQCQVDSRQMRLNTNLDILVAK